MAVKPEFIPTTIAIYLICCAVTSASLFEDVPELSTDARSALVAYYDGRTGVATAGNVVESWTPVDGDGKSLQGMAASSTQRGNG